MLNGHNHLLSGVKTEVFEPLTAELKLRAGGGNVAQAIMGAAGAIAAPCRTKVAEQLLEISVNAGITGVVAKEIADKLSPQELDHLIPPENDGQ